MLRFYKGREGMGVERVLKRKKNTTRTRILREGKNGREGKFLNEGRVKNFCPLCRGRARISTTSKREFFVTIINRRKSLTVFRKNFFIDIVGFLVLPLPFPLL